MSSSRPFQSQLGRFDAPLLLVTVGALTRGAAFALAFELIVAVLALLVAGAPVRAAGFLSVASCGFRLIPPSPSVSSGALRFINDEPFTADMPFSAPSCGHPISASKQQELMMVCFTRTRAAGLVFAVGTWMLLLRIDCAAA